MTHRKREVWLQVTAGQGPSECAWAVVKVLEQIQQEAISASLEFKTIEIEPGPEPGTAQSALVSISARSISGETGLEVFANSWRGTVQWTARSPFRPEHKRKKTMRASGPGGQHVNRTESAVRVTHLPTGVQATAMEERSQHRNRKLALARLANKLNEINSKRYGEAREERWRAHQELERGNPVRVFRKEGE